MNFFVYNVKRFGAKGNNESDDTNAIQDAVNEVYQRGGGRIFFPKGTYKVTTISNLWENGSPIEFIGESVGNTYIAKYGKDTNPLVDFNASVAPTITYIKFENLCLSGTSDYEGLVLTDHAYINFTRFATIGLKTGVVLKGCIDGKIEECCFALGETGLRCEMGTSFGCTCLEFRDTRFHGPSYRGLDLVGDGGFNISHCNFHACGTTDDLNTGGMFTGDGIGALCGYARINIENTWFESNKGFDIRFGSTGHTIYCNVTNCNGYANNRGIRVDRAIGPGPKLNIVNSQWPNGTLELDTTIYGIRGLVYNSVFNGIYGNTGNDIAYMYTDYNHIE
jgi:hypothetical protein